MSKNNYSKEELLSLYLAGDLKGAALSEFEDVLANDPKLQALSISMEKLDGAMLSSFDGNDEMPEDFRNMIKERINELEAETASSSDLITQMKSVFTFKSLLPAGAGAAFAAISLSIFGGPALVMKGADKTANDGFAVFYDEFIKENVKPSIQEMPWMIEEPILTKIIISDKFGNYSRYIGNSTNKVEIGESFLLYATSFRSGTLKVQYIGQDQEITVLVENQKVSLGETIEVSDQGYPWKFLSTGRDKIQILFDGQLVDTIVLDVE